MGEGNGCKGPEVRRNATPSRIREKGNKVEVRASGRAAQSKDSLGRNTAVGGAVSAGKGGRHWLFVLKMRLGYLDMQMEGGGTPNAGERRADRWYKCSEGQKGRRDPEHR